MLSGSVIVQGLLATAVGSSKRQLECSARHAYVPSQDREGEDKKKKGRGWKSISCQAKADGWEMTKYSKG